MQRTSFKTNTKTTLSVNKNTHLNFQNFERKFSFSSSSFTSSHKTSGSQHILETPSQYINACFEKEDQVNNPVQEKDGSNHRFPIMSINRNIRELKPSATVAVNELSNDLRRQGRKVYKLGLGQSPFPVPEPVASTLQQHAYEKDYLPVQGLPELRRSVANYYNSKVKTENNSLGFEYGENDVVIGPGSKELMFILQSVYSSDLVLPMGSWVSYVPQHKIIGGHHIRWIPPKSLSQHHHSSEINSHSKPIHWKITAEALEHECRQDPTCPRLLILNYPNNPTGDTYSATELSEIAKVARRYRVLVLSDEIYAELDHENNHTSIATYYPEGTIISGGISKWAGAGGYRLGAFVVPPTLRWLLKMMTAMASETYTSVSAPIQYAAVKAYSSDSRIEDYLNKSRAIVKQLGSTIHEKLTTAGVQCTAPQGGFYLMPDLTDVLKSNSNKKHIRDSEQMCRSLLKETGIACLPGTDFGLPPDMLSTRIAYVNFDGNNALKNLSSPSECNQHFVEQHCSETIEAIDKLCEWVHS
eukprot:gb/GECH01003977.1/.p1 GENE.gb/GECH01003977.1/~~gb/GECH01003977.1/.p1  ORF type:complete len:528 (+),score=114.70 gb/GECH01003977.1/:1-1584(+)